MEIRLPKGVREIIECFERNGYEAYAVGGCVRDSVLGREPDDWDITTSASPEQTKRLFPRTVDTGIAHGTVTVLRGRETYEVTTYRIDGAYEDARHPKEVTFTSNLSMELQRRDFTINAMAYNETEGLVDLFGGMEDLKSGIVRCVGDARARFEEDALRMLRAVRFSAQLGFVIQEETQEAIRSCADALSRISAERIQAELVKLLLSDHPEYLRKAWECGITAVILPEFDRTMETPQNNPHHCYNVGEHTLAALRHTQKDRCLRLAALFHDFGKPQCRTTDEGGVDHFKGHAGVSAWIAGEILHRLKFDNDTTRRVKKYILYHDVRPKADEKSVRYLVSAIGAEEFAWVLKLKVADTLAQSPQWQKEKLEYLSLIEELYHRILEQKVCLTVEDLAIGGTELIADGMRQGREIGDQLEQLLHYVLEEPDRNTPEQLLAYSRRLRGAAPRQEGKVT